MKFPRVNWALFVHNKPDLFACANQVRKCQVISNGFAKSGIGKNICAPRATWQIGFGPKLTGSHTCANRIRSMWRRFVIGGNRKKLNFSRTPIRRVRAILIDNSFVATHCSARLINSLFPIGNPQLARSRIGFGFLPPGDAPAKGSQKGPFRPRLFKC